MPSPLFTKRKPISHLISKLPDTSINSQLSDKFDMYRSTRIPDLSLLLQYCYIENLMRPIVKPPFIQELILKHFHYSAELEFLVRYKTQDFPMHSFEDNVTISDIERLPQFGVNIEIFLWDGRNWSVDERYEANGKAPICYVMLYKSKMYILYTELMTTLDNYDPKTGRRKVNNFTEDYLSYAEEFLMSDKEGYSTQEETPSLRKAEESPRWPEKLRLDSMKSLQYEPNESTGDTEFLFNSGTSMTCSNMSSFKEVDYIDLILSNSNMIVYDPVEHGNSFIHEEETKVPSLPSSMYKRRDLYFNETSRLETTILHTEPMSPKNFSSDEDVVFDSMSSDEPLDSSEPLKHDDDIIQEIDEEDELDSIHSEGGCNPPQYPHTLRTMSSSAKGYWEDGKDVSKDENICKKSLSSSESFGTSSWATESIANLASLSDFEFFDGSMKGNSSCISDE